MASKEKPVCKYREKCYRKNADHLRDYYHPKQQDDEEEPKPKPKRTRSKEPDDPSSKKPKTIHDFFGAKKDDGDKTVDKVKDKEKVSADKDIDLEKESAEEPASSYVDISEEEEEDADTPPPPSPDDVKENIKRKFLVEMPDDFYDFWEFCKSENKKNPRAALKEALGYKLVGPFDILSGKHKDVTKNRRGKQPNYLLHWRYYYDPPEFMTIVKGDDKKQHHLGYFRDDPSEMPVFVGSNNAADSCVIMQKGDNLFGAVKNCIDDQLRSKGLEKHTKSSLEKLQHSLIDWAKKKDYCLDLKTKKMKDRDKKVVCKSFHNAGIVVPVDANEVGYREVPETPGDLKKMFKKIVDSKTDAERDKNMEDLQELVTLVQFANDECDYGEGLELGMDLFCYGGKVFHSLIKHLLPLAYQFLGRHEFAQIIEAHLKHRRHEASLSEID